MRDEPKPKLSAIMSAKRSNDIMISWSAEDLRHVRPAWDGPEAEHFIQKHKLEIAHALVEAGRAALRRFIEAHESEAAFD